MDIFYTLLAPFDSSVEDHKLCTNIECLDGKFKHTAIDQISCILILYLLGGHICIPTLSQMCFNLLRNIYNKFIEHRFRLKRK